MHLNVKLWFLEGLLKRLGLVFSSVCLVAFSGFSFPLFNKNILLFSDWINGVEMYSLR